MDQSYLSDLTVSVSRLRSADGFVNVFGVVFLDPCRGSSVLVTIRKSTFIKNLAHIGTGALQISFNLDCTIFDTVFRENAGSEAGAIHLTGGSILLNNCTLDSNFGGYTTSTFNGGSLRLVNQGSAFIQNSRIIQSEVNQSFGKNLNFHGGVGLSSKEFGPINISNSSFDFLWKPSTERAIVMEIAQTYINLDNATFIRCPKGYNIKKLASGSKYGQSFECYLCSMGTYSEDRGIYRRPKTHRAKCLLCPYGAKCMKGLQALPNFWGYKVKGSNPPRIAFSQCPMGYCCQAERHQKSCLSYDTCNSKRQGTLCGKCKTGFTETLFTPSCRRSEKCNDFWLWPVAVIFVLGFSLYLVIQPDFVSILWNKVTWFYLSRSQEIAPDDKVQNPGFERIVFFYYQATDILLIQSSYDVWDQYLSQFVLGLFNFEIRLNKEGFACPFPGLDAVSKVFLHSLGVFSVLFAIPFIFMCHCLFCFCLRRDIPKPGSYLSAFFKGTFLGYAVLAAKSMKLLKCVTVNGVNCLFVNCNIQCYTWWQTLLGTLIVIYFIPFVLVLFFGSYKLFNKRISVLHFILAFFLPLPFLSYWFIHRRTLSTKHVPDSEGRDAIILLLIGSYRFPDHMNRGAIYWESVLIGRMLVLILANVLIKDPFLRTLTLLFVCILNLSLHIYIFPFELPTANLAESISLFCLVLMAMFNLPFMAYLSEGVVPTGPMSHIMKVFSWCQAVLVAFLPCVCVLIALAALLSQTVRLIFFISTWLRCACCHVYCCRQCLLDTRAQDRDELVNPLITS